MVSNPRPAAPWYADGLRFSCQQCGNCCSGAPGYVWVIKSEIAAIAECLGLTTAECQRQHVRRVGWRCSLHECRNGDCEFLLRESNGQTGCRIYNARPGQCATWPFWKSNLASPKAWTAAARECPGINHGELHLLAAIQEALDVNVSAARPL
ncbi:MAG: YkgJ family cysteine cluster protein [Planctomycetes bacterium]|nr:YkgJ family cysteine cluster protein [Planctomycetota bacterium]